MEAQDGAGILELTKEIQSSQTALVVPGHGTGEESSTPLGEEEEGGIPIPAPGLLQVTERRQPLSSVSSLEVHFDLLDLTELTDMSDQELAEVFADSDDENAANESPAVSTALGGTLGLLQQVYTHTRSLELGICVPPPGPGPKLNKTEKKSISVTLSCRLGSWTLFSL
ncbi:dysbindin domain-containing protein 1 isoform X1 [Vombatus ursinus]|uniref:dysbindin domain-containing protein 1 isoform X1 n=1 Tax=Vombatus ursinus TaxID=29139 RepID=UPI000FFD148C|nr:dysbindin domain-containing protein 1 isoform X1 [Vombatus ursinus]